MTTLTREEGGNDEKHLQLKLMTAAGTQTATCGGRWESHDLKLGVFFYCRVFKKASPNGKVSVHTCGITPVRVSI